MNNLLPRRKFVRFVCDSPVVHARVGLSKFIAKVLMPVSDFLQKSHGGGLLKFVQEFPPKQVIRLHRGKGAVQSVHRNSSPNPGLQLYRTHARTLPAGWLA